MTGFLAEYYLWLKAVHIISIVVWMAGLLYLPRLFAAHTQVEAGSEADGKFVVLESKLFSSILNPGAIVVFALGILLIIVTGAGSPGSGAWMHAKILLALLLGGVHGMMSKQRKTFAKGENEKSECFFKTFGWVPAVLMILIVWLVVLKPF